MLSTFAPSTHQEQNQKTYQPDYIFVVQQYDGTYIIGAANNPCKRICAINSGFNNAIPMSHTIARIIDSRETNEQRTLVSVVKYFCDKFGSESVVAV